MNSPIICLNCIFKNESKIVLRLLNSVYRIIDCYCIIDTGSTDNTIEVIENFFNDKNIPGKIIKEPFVDFGTTRSFGLKQCSKMSDYILLLDADMIFHIPDENIENFKQKLWNADIHFIFQGSERFYHKNVRVIRNDIGCVYNGPTHEYVSTPEGVKNNQFLKNFVFIRDIGDGGCKSDKFERDVRLLTEDLRKNPTNVRSWFYLANSYADLRQYEKAMDAYKRRIELGGWWEEIWYSQYKIGILLKCLGRIDEAVVAWLETYQINPNRIENLYEIIHYYRNAGKNNLAYSFYVIAHAARVRSLSAGLDYLFVNKEIYDWKLDYEMTIIGYYCNYAEYNLKEICINVLNYPNKIEEHISKNILSNYKFYSDKLINIIKTKKERKEEKEIINTLSVLNCVSTTNLIDNDNKNNEFISSTPSLIKIDNKLYINTRFINYRIGDAGDYINREHISTINVISVFNIEICNKSNNNELSSQIIFSKEDEYILPYNKSIDNVYIGIEDVRLFYKNDGCILYNGNRGMSIGNIVVEHGQVPKNSINTKILEKSRIIHISSGIKNNIEKNWVMFQDLNNNLKYIYGWNPLIIGSVRNNILSEEIDLFYKEYEITTPPIFSYFRGSTNGCRINNELWFICHIVSYESRRYYYHTIVVLDAETYIVKKYTTLFTFEGYPVEYCLGIEYFSETDELLLGYSIMDRETKFMFIKPNDFSWII